MSDPREYYNKHSHGYVSKWASLNADPDKPANFFRKQMFGMAIKIAEVRSGDKVVEIGCGNGLVLKELLKYTTPVFGTDISREMLNRAVDSTFSDKKAIILGDFNNVREQDYVGKEVLLTVDDLLNTHLPQNYFDKILSIEVLRYVENIDGAFNNIKRIMKKDSIFVFTVSNFWSLNLFPIKYKLRKALGLVNEKEEIAQYFVTEKSIIKKLRRNGFDIISFKKIRLLPMRHLMKRIINNAAEAERLSRFEEKLVRLPLLNKFFDTFLIAVKIAGKDQ